VSVRLFPEGISNWVNRLSKESPSQDVCKYQPIHWEPKQKKVKRKGEFSLILLRLKPPTPASDTTAPGFWAVRLGRQAQQWSPPRAALVLRPSDLDSITPPAFPHLQQADNLPWISQPHNHESQSHRISLYIYPVALFPGEPWLIHPPDPHWLDPWGLRNPLSPPQRGNYLVPHWRS
jgi:hypothetical protein